MSVSQGVFYIATGKDYISEVKKSVQSLKKHMPDISVTIATDNIYDADGLFDQTIIVDNPTYSYKDNVDHISKSPYDQTIFLDSDTYITQDISDLFDLLNQFDIAAAHDTGRRRELYVTDEIDVQVPDCFPMYNSGVIAYSDTQQVRELFERWAEIYNRHVDQLSGVVNQPSLREALYHTNINIATLPPEYNCRLPYPTYLRGEVKVIHGRNTNFKKVEQILNHNPTARRTFLMVAGRRGSRIIRLNLDKWQYRQRSLFNSIFERGVIRTIRGAIRHLRGDNFWES